MQPAHIAFILGVNRIVANAHDEKILLADFDGAAAHAFRGGDKGTTLLLW